tara:strand:- start:267 stop:668 length:402 start_codon:yes stop_codon:yes gene_type:complete
MATTRKTDQAAQGVGRKTLYIDFRTVTYTAPVFVVNDVVEMLPVFAGETVLSVELRSDDLDTNGTPLITLDVGDGADVDRYIDGSTIAQGGGYAKATLGIPYTYSVADTVDILVAAAPATGAAGDLTLTILVG